MNNKRPYTKPSSKVLDFHTKYDSMVQGDPRGSFVVKEFEEDDPVVIGGDDDGGNAKYGKSLWDVNF